MPEEGINTQADQQSGEVPAPSAPTLEQQCEFLRSFIRDVGADVKRLMTHEEFRRPTEDFPGQHGEMMANLMLSFRHLEDARMRLGKVMQQIQGGVSIFDREKDSTTEGPETGQPAGGE